MKHLAARTKIERQYLQGENKMMKTKAPGNGRGGGRAAEESGSVAKALKDAPHRHVCDSKAHDISETSYAIYANKAKGQASSEGRKRAGQAG